jgi:phosphoglycerate kinase
VEVGFVDWEEADRYFKNGGGMGMGRREKVLIWENLRFWKGEKGNDSGFAGELAALGEIYVNEAFAVSHREHASVVGVPRVMKEQGKPVVAGFHVAKEVEMLSRILENPKRPVVVILGGAKTETKLPVIEGLWKIADVFLLGGVVANTFLVIEDEHPKKLGQSVWDNHQTDEARKLWGFSKQFKFRFKGEGGREVELKRIVLPRDLVVAHWDGKDFYNQEEVESYHRVGEVFDQTKGIWELGERTASLFAEIVAQAGTVVWAGPLGYCEEERFCKSSQQVAEAMAGNAAAFKVAGGGDTEAMLTKFGVEEKFDWISSGGGAMMEFLADRGKLPGLTVLS